MNRRELELDWDKKIAKADTDEEKAALRLEKAEAIVEFLESENAAAQAENWRATVLKEFPEAIPEMVTGNNIDEMRESAKKSHDMVTEKITAATAAAVERAKAEGSWGPQTSGGGGAPDTESDENKFIETAWKAIREETLSKAQANKLIDTRIGNRMNRVIEELGGVSGRK